MFGSFEPKTWLLNLHVKTQIKSAECVGNLGRSSNTSMKTVCTGLSKKMDGIWNRYNLKSTGRIYTFGILKCSEKFKVLDLP